MDKAAEIKEETPPAAQLRPVLPAPIEASRSACRLPNPRAMPLAQATAPLRDQVVSQQVTSTVHHHTPWQWAEPLCLVGVKTVRDSLEVKTNLKRIPMRQATTTGLIPSQDGDTNITPLYDTIVSALSRPVGEFAAGRFFNLPGTLDMTALACIVCHFEGSPSRGRDEAPFLRGALLGELAMTANNVKKVAQLPTRVAPTLSISGVKRSVTDFGQLAPDGKVLCVDLGMYTKLASGAKALGNSCEMFMPDHWGVDTAVVPISITGSGSRWAAPYVLPFVGTEYWNLKVYYELKCKDSSQSQAGQGEVSLTTAPYASLSLVSGEENVLLVLVDFEHRLIAAGKFDIVGEGHLIPIVGASTGNLDRVAGVSMRAVVAGVLGEPGEDVAPPRSQRDVSLAWRQLV